MKERYRELLQHTLGADSRYKKKQWGYRNRFVADEGHHDYPDLLRMEEAGLLTSRIVLDQRTFHATKAGAVAIGFKPYQLKNAGLS